MIAGASHVCFARLIVTLPLGDGVYEYTHWFVAQRPPITGPSPAV
jgi:hypothetical protein